MTSALGGGGALRALTGDAHRGIGTPRQAEDASEPAAQVANAEEATAAGTNAAGPRVERATTLLAARGHHHAKSPAKGTGCGLTP